MKNIQTLILKYSKGEIDLLTVNHAICQKICEQLQVTRASIWNFENNNHSVKCVSLYDSRTNEFSENAIITDSDVPSYFNSILRDGYIVATDARNNNSTSILSDSYFVPLDIFSLLDHVVLHNKQIVAILCCEHCGSIRQWTPNDESFLRTMSALVSLLYKF